MKSKTSVTLSEDLVAAVDEITGTLRGDLDGTKWADEPGADERGDHDQGEADEPDRPGGPGPSKR